MRCTTGDDQVFGFVSLNHQMHRAHVILSVPPVAARLKVADAQFRRESLVNVRHGRRDLASDKLKTASRALVIEENSADAEHAVSFAVIARQIEASHFANSIR